MSFKKNRPPFQLVYAAADDVANFDTHNDFFRMY